MSNAIGTVTRPASRVRRILAKVTTAARSVVRPSTLFAAPAATALPERADMYTAEDMPSATDIDDAAAAYFTAVDRARAAGRGKCASRKILDRLPAGQYGRWLVARTESGRQTVDLDQIRATYKALGLGPVPMKATAPSLRVELLASDTDTLDDDTAGLLEDLAGADTDLDTMLDAARLLLTRPRSADSTTTLVAALAGGDTSLMSLITTAVSRLADPATNPAIASLPAERVQAAQDWAASFARTIADSDGQDDAAEVCAALDPRADYRPFPTPRATTTAASAADLIAV